MPNPKVIKAKNQIIRKIKNRILTIYRDGNWVHKIDLLEGKVSLSIGEEMVYDEK